MIDGVLNFMRSEKYCTHLCRFLYKSSEVEFRQVPSKLELGISAVVGYLRKYLMQ